MKSKAIVLHPDDMVATALQPVEEGETIAVQNGGDTLQMTVRDSIQFGHKFALRDIEAGEDILKYGLPIGKALEGIGAGRWVHVHNCRSDRFGHRHEQYGINA